MIAEKIIGNRAGRIEPRLIKKRSNAYRLLMKSRTLAKQDVMKNGQGPFKNLCQSGKITITQAIL